MKTSPLDWRDLTDVDPTTYAIILPPTGDPERAEPDNGTDFTLAELQGVVGGYIETVPMAGIPTSVAVLVVDEDGRRKHTTQNTAATSIAGQLIVGPALLCPRRFLK